MSRPSLTSRNNSPPSPTTSSKESRKDARFEPVPSDDLAATGIGRKFDHRVQRVRFEAEPAAPTVVEIRYEYRDALIRLGALPPSPPYWEDPLERRENARGFDDLDFAPDPYR